jgi:hypothetical protein
MAWIRDTTNLPRASMLRAHADDDVIGRGQRLSQLHTVDLAVALAAAYDAPVRPEQGDEEPRQ